MKSSPETRGFIVFAALFLLIVEFELKMTKTTSLGFMCAHTCEWKWWGGGGKEGVCAPFPHHELCSGSLRAGSGDGMECQGANPDGPNIYPL